MKKLPFLLYFIFFVAPSFGIAATRYWVGSGNWNSSSNWAYLSSGIPGASVPTSIDTAYFESTDSSFCIIDTNIVVAGISLLDVYAGKIQLLPGYTLSIGLAGYTQAAGTFIGADGDISSKGPFKLWGGIFNSTVGNLELSAGFHALPGTFNPNGGTISFVANQQISGNANFYNVTILAYVLLNCNLDVNGNLLIGASSSCKLDVSSSSFYQINIAGNWTNLNSVTLGSFNQNNGKVVFDGAANQHIVLSHPTHTEIFYNAELNNSQGLTLHANVQIFNSLNFILGIIYATTNCNLYFINAATTSGASYLSFVSGPVYKTGKQAFTFPVGKNSVYAPISIGVGISTLNQFKAEYFQSNPTIIYDSINMDISIQHISQCEYWMLLRTIGNGNLAVKLSWDTRSCGVTNLSELRVVSWNGSVWNNSGNGGTTGSLAVGTILSGAASTNFSAFSLASTALSNPLPINLLSFSAQLDENRVELKWTTSSEYNNDFFTIEKSLNGTDWKPIAVIYGAGNSTSTLQYHSFDLLTLSNNYYYRLKQTDFNGSFSYSNSVPVSFANNDFSLSVFPNPCKKDGLLNLAIDVDITGNYSVTIFDLYGRACVINDLNSPQNLHQIVLNLNDKLPVGMYYISVMIINKKYTKLLMIN
ncbi:MAG: T9SS type A sorting domain-containing protein [Bacteroidetes bacterium]|nr:T9SS type A sorting domain-containing protein [Bacteroidota bacterium]